MRRAIGRLAQQRWLRDLGIVWMVASCVVLLYGMLVEPQRLIERDVRLAPSRWPAACDGLRLDHVTDVHTLDDPAAPV